MSETATRARPSRELLRRDPADVAEALHDARLLGEVPAEPPHARSVTITTPAPVASCRNSEPPSATGFR
jgi:hypothetical protein